MASTLKQQWFNIYFCIIQAESLIFQTPKTTTKKKKNKKQISSILSRIEQESIIR